MKVMVQEASMRDKVCCCVKIKTAVLNVCIFGGLLDALLMGLNILALKTVSDMKVISISLESNPDHIKGIVTVVTSGVSIVIYFIELIIRFRLWKRTKQLNVQGVSLWLWTTGVFLFLLVCNLIVALSFGFFNERVNVANGFGIAAVVYKIYEMVVVIFFVWAMRAESNKVAPAENTGENSDYSLSLD